MNSEWLITLFGLDQQIPARTQLEPISDEQAFGNLKMRPGTFGGAR